MSKKNKKHSELIKQAEYYLPCSDLSYDDYYSLRMALFDTRSMLKMCAEKLREIKNQIKKCSQEFEMN